MTDVTRSSENLARNVRQLREARGLSQAQLAKLSGVPRPTWANLESGAANPTLAVLLKVSATLQVSLEELVGPPRAAARLYKAGEVKERKRGQTRIRDLLPDPMPGLQMERLELSPRGGMTGIPHTAGTREYLCCERGTLQLSAGGETWRLGPGDVLVFRGDQKHAYRNVGTKIAVAYSVVALAPPAP
ncbi:MAG: XRE family transcriptional regulator [Myxococcota bacterium]